MRSRDVVLPVQPVTSLLLEYLPNTLELALAAIVISLLLAVPTGVLSAVYQDTWIDRTSQFAALIGVSMPNFWLGYVLILVCSLWLGLTPVSGSGTLAHLMFPAITLGTGMATRRATSSSRSNRPRKASGAYKGSGT